MLLTCHFQLSKHHCRQKLTLTDISTIILSALKQLSSVWESRYRALLRPVHWQIAPLAKPQALPTGAKPVTSSEWHDLDEAFFTVAEGIRKTVEDLIGSAPPPLTRVDRAAADRKVDEARKKVQQWGERIVREEQWRSKIMENVSPPLQENPSPFAYSIP